MRPVTVFLMLAFALLLSRNSQAGCAHVYEELSGHWEAKSEYDYDQAVKGMQLGLLGFAASSVFWPQGMNPGVLMGGTIVTGFGYGTAEWVRASAAAQKALKFARIQRLIQESTLAPGIEIQTLIDQDRYLPANPEMIAKVIREADQEDVFCRNPGTPMNLEEIREWLLFQLPGVASVQEEQA